MKNRRWTSPRALLTHLGAVVAVALCVAAARWQIHRAASGNLLSYAYAVEWPLFAIAAVVLWWQLLHDDRSRRAGEVPTPSPTHLPDPPVDDPALRSYNEELAALSATGRRKTWRNPRGLP